MEIITLSKTKDYQIGNVRVDKTTFDKVSKIAKEQKVSNQQIVRAILERLIDAVSFK